MQTIIVELSQVFPISQMYLYSTLGPDSSQHILPAEQRGTIPKFDNLTLCHLSAPAVSVPLFPQLLSPCYGLAVAHLSTMRPFVR
jgi:hypothetical protein